MARYPEIRVSMRSSNPLALVAAVRAELRRNRVDPEEISRFSDEAMARAGEGTRLRELCLEWIGEVTGGPTAGPIPLRESVGRASESGAGGVSSTSVGASNGLSTAPTAPSPLP